MGTFELEWNPREYKEELLALLATNGQQVGEFVRHTAQGLLEDVEDPEWGDEYRAFVAGLIGFDIEKKTNEVVITVGVKGGYSRWHGYYIELGTSRRPPHPFLRPAVFSHGKEITDLLVGK